MNKPTVKIENWSVVDGVMSPAFRDLEPGWRLTGTIFGHAELPNGIIYTSAIVNVDTASGTVETHNTIYQLGQVSNEYARWDWERWAARTA
jgi:hypothetical protein